MEHQRKFEELEDEYFPFKKLFDDGFRFAYVAPLTFGRGRICLTDLNNCYGVQDFW